MGVELVKVAGIVAIAAGMSFGLFTLKQRMAESADHIRAFALVLFVPTVAIVAIVLSDKFDGATAALMGTIAGFALSNKTS